MVTTIVLLPLAGAIIAGLIAMLGAARVTRERQAGQGTHDHAHGHDAHAAHAHDDHAHDDHGHGHADDDPEEFDSPGIKPAQFITTGLLFLAAILSWITLISVAFNEGGLEQITVLSWIQSGSLIADWTIRVDTLTAVMLVVVTTVSALVHLYSIGYMAHDRHIPRFFAYLSLFTFAMLALVTADNLVQLFFGWEGVGLASYLLIGFWYKKPSASAAAIKAFIVNRVGDFGFALGIFALFFMFDTVDLGTIFAGAEGAQGTTISFLGAELDALTIACFLLFIGAMGKSAQFLLHTWLADAMEGPTPVSALIHAATMVTAGVFLVARMSPLFEYAPQALEFVTFIGATTAFCAATIGLVQNDIKRVIAYSTMSQLGYMFVAIGIGAYPVAIFHLFTHAFFKALLFLGAGSVIHAVGGEQDMRKMGGLRKKIPLTYAMMLVGTLALTGFPLTAGYFSKDAIVEVAAAGAGLGAVVEEGVAHALPVINSMAGYAFFLTVVAAIFTSFYSWRLIFLTFHGTFRGSQHTLDHAHESPPVMMVPLFVLAAGALLAGLVFSNPFIGDHALEEFWQGSILNVAANHIMHDFHYVEAWIPWAPTFAMALGLLFAVWFYIWSPGTPKRLAAEQDVAYRFLLNAWYFDKIYDFLFVRPALWLGRFLWKRGDGWLIDGFGPDGVSSRVLAVTRNVVRIQSGYIYHYAFAMLIGAALLITWMLFR
ncbi:MAG: NADH-quinone oxidoreductase subunit L [Bauldia sp.]|nr:NADH-quinone oxidoreductase subunit L [Bauldia sp.]